MNKKFRYQSYKCYIHIFLDHRKIVSSNTSRLEAQAEIFGQFSTNHKIANQLKIESYFVISIALAFRQTIERESMIVQKLHVITLCFGIGC